MQILCQSIQKVILFFSEFRKMEIRQNPGKAVSAVLKFFPDLSNKVGGIENFPVQFEMDDFLPGSRWTVDLAAGFFQMQPEGVEKFPGNLFSIGISLLISLPFFICRKNPGGSLSDFAGIEYINWQIDPGDLLEFIVKLFASLQIHFLVVVLNRIQFRKQLFGSFEIFPDSGVPKDRQKNKNKNKEERYCGINRFQRNKERNSSDGGRFRNLFGILLFRSCLIGFGKYGKNLLPG